MTAADTASPQVHATGGGLGSVIRQYLRPKIAKPISTSAGQTISQCCQPSAVKIAQPISCQVAPTTDPSPKSSAQLPVLRQAARSIGGPGSGIANAKYAAYLTSGPAPTSPSETNPPTATR